MELHDIINAMQNIESNHKLSKEIVIEALEEALAKAYRKHVEIPDALVRVAINEKTGMIKVYKQRRIVAEVEDDELEISLADAKRIKQEFELDEFVEEEVNIAEMGRAAVVLAKNVMKQKIREAEKQAVYDEYCDKVEEMVFGTVETVEDKFVIVNLGKAMALMPKNQQIPNEKYSEGQRLRVVITEVNRETKGAQVLVSRGDATLVKRLFEKEVPEIFQGVIEIKAIAREAGERTKMAVYSANENVDPIGACIGPRGQRVQVVIDELRGEKIDIFEWSEDVSELIKNALAPAEVLGVIPNPERKNGLIVVVADHQLSLAIGKRGKNARLAVKLTGSKIDIKAQSEIEEAGIDWRTIAQEQRDLFLQKQAEEKAKAQALLFETKDSEDLPLETPDFAYHDVIEDTHVDEMLREEALAKQNEALPSEDSEAQVQEESAPLETEMSKPQKEEGKDRKPADDLAEAARLAKEKQRQEGINIKEKQQYVSKFEKILDTKPQKKESFVRPKYKRRDDEEPKRKATFDLSKKDYELKPIYTEEELEEIARQEQEEAENDWINDDIDFDEYDEYYDE
ncbi:MAG: transcription termination/antitermination protein NusA [Erysipelotrichaceae bacterium]|nr:transcription termination/antitermination protein NusA [Erysipelotrichaceae bacterium]MCI9312069.1 transcription termination/antitermination protein NusA [Erysipelotrichaceae bacterium]